MVSACVRSSRQVECIVGVQRQVGVAWVGIVQQLHAGSPRDDRVVYTLLSMLLMLVDACVQVTTVIVRTLEVWRCWLSNLGPHHSGPAWHPFPQRC
jgi:hypothetical protein